MAAIETIAFFLGILAGIAFGLYWAYRKIKKGNKNIPDDILQEFNQKNNEKEVQENSKKNNKEESNKEDSGSDRGRGDGGRTRRFGWGRRPGRRPGGRSGGGREPTGFTDEKGKSLKYGNREPNDEKPIVDNQRTDPIKKQRSIPIQPSTNIKRSKSISPRSERNPKRTERNSKKDWESFD